MKHRYIEVLESEIQQLALQVANLKEGKKVPFSFFKDSFSRTQEITRLLHELEFMQIEDMRGQMEKLVQYLSYAENSKKEVTTEPVEPKEAIDGIDKTEVASNKEEQKITESEDKTGVTDSEEKSQHAQKEEKEESLIVQELENDSQKVEEVEVADEAKDIDEVEEDFEKVEMEEIVGDNSSVSAHTNLRESIKQTAEPMFPLPNKPNNKSETILANITPKNKSLNDVQPVNHTIQDAKRSISLNDRFLFQRELFNNNRDAMNTMLTKLQSFSSFDLAESYLERNTTWDFRDETVSKFLQMLKDGFR